MRLEGKVAIVAGAAWGGIGAATAYRFACEGAKVVVNTRRREEKLAETVQRIQDAGGDAVAVMGDVADEATWQTLVETTLSNYGKITTLVHNAAHSYTKKAIEFTMEEWNESLGVTLGGPWLGAKYCIPEMIRNGGGAVVFISTVNATITNPGFGLYGAGKRWFECVDAEYCPRLRQRRDPGKRYRPRDRSSANAVKSLSLKTLSKNKPHAIAIRSDATGNLKTSPMPHFS